MTLQCIAVDDEPLALGLVCKFIGQTPFLNLAGSYLSSVEALKAMHTQKIDILFLDIQMADLNGIELARVLGKMQEAPQIIFTTAYNQFALEGYKVDARDYLLKPFNYEEFLRATNKAYSYAQLLQKPVATTSSVSPMEEQIQNEYLFLKVEYQLVRIALSDILYIEGLKDYVKVHLLGADKTLLSLTSLKALEEKLPPKRFMRLHRSFIVALDKITSMTKNSVQVGKMHIAVGDQYKDAFSQFLGKWI